MNVSALSLECTIAVGQATNNEEQIFKDALGTPQVSSKHTIGMWKGRFPWLWSIHMKITSFKTSVQSHRLKPPGCLYQ